MPWNAASVRSLDARRLVRSPDPQLVTLTPGDSQCNRRWIHREGVEFAHPKRHDPGRYLDQDRQLRRRFTPLTDKEACVRRC